MKLFNKKSRAVKNWRSRAWSIDPKVTNLTIIKTEAKLENIDIKDFNLNFNLHFSQLLKNYPQYFEAVADIEQFRISI
jgi:hypothetical protein